MDFGPFSASKIAEGYFPTYTKESTLMEIIWHGGSKVIKLHMQLN